MTLFKQIAIAISTIIIILVATVILINFQSVKQDMIDNLYETSVNNISTLTQKIADANEDKAMIVTTIDAEFDSGYYKLIDFNATQANLSYKQVDNSFNTDIPRWFIELIDIELQTVNSDVTSGWNIVGKVTILGDANIVYVALYKLFFKLLILFVISVLISLVVMYGILYFILKPLHNIEKQAVNIAQGKFQRIKKLPWTTEIKNVSIAMNDMSQKIENVIGKLNSNLETMTKKLSKDDLTGLELQQTFETDMKQMFIEKSEGYVFSVKINELGEYAKNHTKQEVDRFLIDFSKILNNSSQKIRAYRFFGSEFALIGKNTSYEETKTIINQIKTQLEELAKQIEQENITYIGATPFNPISTTPNILAAANEALEQAKHIGPNEAHIRDDNDLARDMQEWKDIVFEIVEKGLFQVDYINQSYGLQQDNENSLLMEEAFTVAKDKNGAPIPIGTFISIAEKYDKVIAFDKSVILKVIEHIKHNNIKNSIIINLSLDSVTHGEFKSWLNSTVKDHNEIASQLVFSVTAYGVAKNIKQFKEFIDVVHSSGAKVIIKRFETKFIPLESLQEFKLDYIRLARDYTNSIDKDSAKQGIVESMQDLSELLNIKVFAESVKDNDDLNRIKSIGIYGASR